MKDKKVSIELIFDDKDAASNFVAAWLDGGLDGGGNLDWDTCYKESDKWDKHLAKFLRIKGTGYPIDEDGIVVTPEIEQERFDKYVKQLKERK